MVIGEVQGRQLIGRPLSMLLTGGCGYGDLRFNQLSISGAVRSGDQTDHQVK